MVDAEKLIPYRALVATDDNVKKSLDDLATNMAATISSSPFGEGEPTVAVAVAVFTIRKKGQEEFVFLGQDLMINFTEIVIFLEQMVQLFFMGTQKIQE